MPFDPNKPYDDLPLLPPTEEIETKSVTNQAMLASHALTALRSASRHLTEGILINAFSLQEAVACSKIEGIISTQNKLYRAILDDCAKADSQTTAILNCRKALRYGYEALKAESFSVGLIRRLCCILREQQVDFRADDQVANMRGSQFDVHTYTPPRGGAVLRHKLDNLESYLLQKNGHDPLIRMAVSHYQFMALQPFDDGNGRTGRMLNILYLVSAGCLALPILCISRFIQKNMKEYNALRQAVTEKGDWQGWLSFMLRVVEETALYVVERIHKIRDLMDLTTERCSNLHSRLSSNGLIELIFRHPCCKIATLVNAQIAEKKTASAYLHQLESLGILQSKRVGRETLYFNHKLLQLLN